MEAQGLKPPTETQAPDQNTARESLLHQAIDVALDKTPFRKSASQPASTDSSTSLASHSQSVSADASKSSTDIGSVATDFVKTASLFVPGVYGIAASGITYGLDNINSKESGHGMAMDAALGFCKGAAMHELYRVGAKTNLSPAAQGVILGSLSRAVDTGMSRETYTSNGKSDFVGGLFKVGTNVFDGQAMLADATIFTVAHGGFKLAGKMTGGALERSNFARTTLIGGSFGATTGGWQEIQRERQTGAPLDVSQIVTSSALSGALGAFAAVPGAYMSRGTAPLHFDKETNKADVVAPKNSFPGVDAITKGLDATTRHMDAPANEAQVRYLFEQITHPQGSHAMSDAHAETLRLFANNPQLETVARQIHSELRKSGAENNDIIARLIRVGFKNEPLDTSELTESQSRALDRFTALAKDLHVVDKHAEAQEGIFKIIARAELPTRIEQQLHEQSRDPLLVQTLDTVLGTDYIHSVPINKQSAATLEEMAQERGDYKERNAERIEKETELGRNVYRTRENIIGLLKESEFAKNGGDWPSLMRDMFEISHETRWPPLSTKVVNDTLGNVQTLLEKAKSETDPAKAEIFESTAMQMIRLTREPRLTSQAAHPTCTMGSLEYYYWKMFPDEASRVVTQTVLNNGRFVTADGTTIRLTKNDLKPEAKSLDVPVSFAFDQNPPRAYASQIFQMMAPNIYWQRQTTDLTGAYTPKGSIHYKMTKNGDQLVKKTLGSPAENLADGPYVSTSKILEDIGHQIGGPRTVPNVIEWGTQFATRDDFVKAILSFNHEPVIVAIDHENWNDRSKPAQYTSHAITIDGVAPSISGALYHNTWGEAHDHPVNIDKIYSALP